MEASTCLFLRWYLVALVSALSLLCTNTAFAHKPSDSYITLTAKDQIVTGTWDVSVRDLEYVLALDSDKDRKITWSEIVVRTAELSAYAKEHVSISTHDQVCPLTIAPLMIDHHSDGAYVVFPLTFECSRPFDTFEISYSLLFDVDPSHRGIVRMNGGVTLVVLSPTAPRANIPAHQSGDASWLAQAFQFCESGVWHILLGTDHLLFLLVLLLPAAYRRESISRVPVSRFSECLLEVAKVITSFTIAHSVSLALVTFGYITPPTRFIESAIALSIVLTAIDNVLPSRILSRWTVAFTFGLIHGCGFASVLQDAGVTGTALIPGLVGFNIGVEVGQLTIATLILPIIFQLRDSPTYKRYGYFIASVAATVIATLWFAERAFDLSIF